MFALRLQDKKLPPLLSEIWDVHERLIIPCIFCFLSWMAEAGGCLLEVEPTEKDKHS